MLEEAIKKHQNEIVQFLISKSTGFSYTYQHVLTVAENAGNTVAYQPLQNSGAKYTPEQQIKRLFAYINENQHDRLKNALGTGVSVNITDDKQQTPLHYLVQVANRAIAHTPDSLLTMFSLLLAFDANVDAQEFKRTLHTGRVSGTL